MHLSRDPITEDTLTLESLGAHDLLHRQASLAHTNEPAQVRVVQQGLIEPTIERIPTFIG